MRKNGPGRASALAEKTGLPALVAQERAWSAWGSFQRFVRLMAALYGR